MQRPWRKEDNNTSKQHSPGKRKEGGEPASKGLQHKVKKELRQRSCKTLSLWDSEKWRRNLAHSQQMLLQKPWETLPYLDSWVWTFLSGRRQLPRSRCSAAWADAEQHTPWGNQPSSFLSKHCPVTSVHLSHMSNIMCKVLKESNLWK